MATGLQAKNYVNLSGYWYSGGYPGEYTGGSGAYDSWTDVPLSGSATSEYWYSDSDTGRNSNSIVTHVYITDEWNAVVNNDNSITVNYSSEITKIEKVEVYGNPGTTPRTIFIYQKPGGSKLYQYINTPMTPHVVDTNLDTISGYITLPPESEQSEQSTVYYKSGYNNHMDDPLPSIYVDAMGMGLSFKNILPKDYRPGQHLVDGVWESHNRANGGRCEILKNGVWTEMRTVENVPGLENPPTIMKNGSWISQAKIGAHK